MPANAKRHAARSRLRIIGGRWRGRSVHFTERPGLRPTPDRVRETLFNWLAPVIEGSRCLDLFAGSGALAWEALSRGAAAATLVESDPIAAQALRITQQQLQADNASIVLQDSRSFLAQAATPFDIVFLDPPFHSDLLPQVYTDLSGWIRPGGFIYIETAKQNAASLPADWEILRAKTAGQVAYHLARQQ